MFSTFLQFLPNSEVSSRITQVINKRIVIYKHTFLHIKITPNKSGVIISEEMKNKTDVLFSAQHYQYIAQENEWLSRASNRILKGHDFQVTLGEKIIQRFFNQRTACAEIKTQQYDLSRGRVELSCDSELARVRSRAQSLSHRQSSIDLYRKC